MPETFARYLKSWLVDTLFDKAIEWLYCKSEIFSTKSTRSRGEWGLWIQRDFQNVLLCFIYFTIYREHNKCPSKLCQLL